MLPSGFKYVFEHKRMNLYSKCPDIGSCSCYAIIPYLMGSHFWLEMLEIMGFGTYDELTVLANSWSTWALGAHKWPCFKPSCFIKLYVGVAAFLDENRSLSGLVNTLCKGISDQMGFCACACMQSSFCKCSCEGRKKKGVCCVSSQGRLFNVFACLPALC